MATALIYNCLDYLNVHVPGGIAMQILMKSIVLLVMGILAAQAGTAAANSKWVSLDADSKNRLMKIVRTEVESREGFSTLEEDRLNTLMVAKFGTSKAVVGIIICSKMKKKSHFLPKKS